MSFLNPSSVRSLASRVRRKAERVLFSTGQLVECPFCQWTGWRFMSAGRPRRGNRLCPQCGSLERYRMLPLVMEREVGAGALKILELAPKACFTNYCQKKSSWDYISSDLDSPTAMVHADLRAMPFESERFDVIICMHVMEHIKDDVVAFSEIERMLKHGGVGIICVPIRGEITQEGAPEEEWERLYGQSDHVRYYGLDIEDRMKQAGLKVHRLDALTYFSPDDLSRYALRGDDRYLFLVSPSVPS